MSDGTGAVTRVFVPATIAMLRVLREDGEFLPLGRTAFAVTPALREAYTAGDDDELAEAAKSEAARASLRLIAAQDDAAPPDATGGDDADPAPDPDAPAPTVGTGPVARRVVVVADVPGVTERPDLDDAVVRVAGPIALADVAAVHVDLEAAERDVARAAAVIDAADLGDEDAEFVLGDAEDHELAWYATQELGFLLDLL